LPTRNTISSVSAIPFRFPSLKSFPSSELSSFLESSPNERVRGRVCDKMCECRITVDTGLCPRFRVVIRRRHRQALAAAPGGCIHTRLSTTRPLPSSNARSLAEPHRVVRGAVGAPCSARYWCLTASTLFPCTGHAVLQPQRDHAYPIPYRDGAQGPLIHSTMAASLRNLHAHASVSPPGPSRPPRSNRNGT
jgi:hypothetical protein